MYGLLPIALLSIFTIAAGHGFMSKPNIRGSLPQSKFVSKGFDNDAPKDHWAHFPAGNKNSRPGSGLASQRRAAGPRGWTPFKPLDPSFRWRAGVCGDEKIPGKKQPHLRGGRYYYDGKITATYRQGGIIDAALSIIAHHNGFMELHVCDVDKCGGDISETCFRQGYCQQLKRARNKECDSGNSKRCGPIDPNYPGRWYLPCTTVGERGWEVFGDDTIKYYLPANLACEHCVLQWFWSAANTCNPPGVVEYFDGPNSPNWGKCRGQGGAIGGVTRVQRPCSATRFPEEYLDCADIRILPRGPSKVDSHSGSFPDTREEPVAAVSPTPDPSPMPSYSNSPRPSPRPSQSKSPRPSPQPSRSTTPRPSPDPSQSKTPRPSPNPSKSETRRPSPDPSQSKTPRPSPTPNESETPRPSPEPSQSKTPRPSPKPSKSETPRPSPEPSLSKTPRPSPKPSLSKAPRRPSPQPSRSSTPRPSPRPSQSRTPPPSPKPSRSSTPRPSPKPSRSSTPRPSPKPSRSSTPKPSPKKKPGRARNTVPSPSKTPAPSPSASPSPSPVSVTDFEFTESSMEPSIEPSFFPEESPEESFSPEPEFSPDPSSDDYELNPFEPNPRTGVITDIILVADGKDIRSVQNGDIINISTYDKIALKAVTKRKVHKVEFYIDGERVWTEHHMEYFLFGNSETSPFYWKNPPLHTWLEVVTVTEKEQDLMNIMFTQ